MTLPIARRIAVSFPALRHRDFTLLWIGQFLSFAGSRMQTAAILWHVSLLAAPGRKAIALGLVGAVQVVPIIAFAMLSGVGADAVSFLMVIAALLVMRARPRQATAPPPTRITWAAAREGLRFVFAQPIVRSTMLLDFAATFFASATALLPIFAQDILHVGARGYGWLYAAPSVGAAVTGVVMAYAIDRIERRGAVLLWSVAAYGAATVVFGLSHTFWLTLLCLAAVGAADTVSTVIRNIIRQLETPDELRGRMTGVNMIFFMGGPQLGELEAGTVAQLFGAVASVVSGGLRCLLAPAGVGQRGEGLGQDPRGDVRAQVIAPPQLAQERHELHSLTPS